MPHQEWATKTGRKCSLWFGHAHLGASDFGRVAADEVVHRLRLAEPAHRRQYAERVASQKDHIARMFGDAGNLGVADELDRIGATSVLGDAAAVKIDVVRHLVVDDVFEHRAESQRLIDLPLSFWR